MIAGLCGVAIFAAVRGHPGQYSDGANDGDGVFHAAEPAGEHLGVSGGVDEAV